MAYHKIEIETESEARQYLARILCDWTAFFDKHEPFRKSLEILLSHECTDEQKLNTPMYAPPKKTDEVCATCVWDVEHGTKCKEHTYCYKCPMVCDVVSMHLGYKCSTINYNEPCPYYEPMEVSDENI